MILIMIVSASALHSLMGRMLLFVHPKCDAQCFLYKFGVTKGYDTAHKIHKQIVHFPDPYSDTISKLSSNEQEAQKPAMCQSGVRNVLEDHAM